LFFRDSWPAALAGRIWPPAFRVWTEQLALRKPLGAAPTLRIAFASDFHTGPLTSPASVQAACTALMSAAPDLILLGGDFVSIAHRHARHLVAPLSNLRAPLGVHAVLGNHDHWAGASEVGAMLSTAGVNLLVNRSHRFPAPWENTLLVGLDDHLSGYPDASRAEWNPECATLLLIHQPSGLLDVGDHTFDAAFAGHTHGGQITMPGGYAPVVPYGSLSRRYLGGRYDIEDRATLFVSVGVGNSSLPLRFGPKPEILVCEVSSTIS
jgi:predicted MPP superfamily phosphohydrolase